MLPVIGFRKYRERMAIILFVHDNRRSVQKFTATGRGVQNSTERRHDHRQFWRSVFTLCYFNLVIELRIQKFHWLIILTIM